MVSLSLGIVISGICLNSKILTLVFEKVVLERGEYFGDDGLRVR
jgi:hypothetical protein